MTDETTAVEPTTEPVAAPAESSTEAAAPVDATPKSEPATEAAPAADTEAKADDSADPDAEARPDWMMDKYKTVEDQAKAYKELTSKVGKYWGAPKDDYSLEGIDGVKDDDPLLSNLAPALKEMGLSQEGFKDLVKHFQAANVKMVEKFENELKEVITGKDAATYNAVSSWMEERLKPEEIEQVKNNWLMTPADFHLFNQLRLMAAPSSNVPSHQDGGGPRFESSKAVENDKIKYRKEIKEKIRVPDKNYENELAQRYRDALTREQRAKG